FTRLPDAQKPNPLEPALRDLVEHRVGQVVERRGPAELRRELVQRDAGVDRVEGRGAHPRYRAMAAGSAPPCSLVARQAGWRGGVETSGATSNSVTRCPDPVGHSTRKSSP